jgi:hypothetical protein
MPIVLFYFLFNFLTKVNWKLLLEKHQNSSGHEKSLPTISQIQVGVSSTQTLSMTHKIAS